MLIAQNSLINIFDKFHSTFKQINLFKAHSLIKHHLYCANAERKSFRNKIKLMFNILYDPIRKKTNDIYGPSHA
jgi:hypothetical protein